MSLQIFMGNLVSGVWYDPQSDRAESRGLASIITFSPFGDSLCGSQHVGHVSSVDGSHVEGARAVWAEESAVGYFRGFVEYLYFPTPLSIRGLNLAFTGLIARAAITTSAIKTEPAAKSFPERTPT